MSFPSKDLRDPTALGSELLHIAALATRQNDSPVVKRNPLSWLYDHNLKGEGRIPDYDGSGDIKTATPSGAEH